MILRVQGQMKLFRNMPQMANPKWRAIDAETDRIEESKFRPIYPATAKLTSDVIQRVIEDHLQSALPAIHEWFPSRSSTNTS